ncbi:hypothetical protein [Marinobacter sp.]|jgi:hypothetical protein|uniref:hypothetical protein n=1 Tax=Marinobacter sp. TaxID=50741 RepID=UPI000C963C21|nr:hypothetical protein [Marinobacter sp.]MAK51588.1 hypothetical protein [Marinobacter sp.]|tara:strand:- start:120 stop:407 length:288 start_codon:yes stop_codon:yes gene_type:complete
MVVKVLQSVKVATNKEGIGSGKRYAVGEELPTDEDWQKQIAQNLIDAGIAEETKIVKPQETKAPAKKKKRAKNDDGTFKADDKSTPNVNEAWETK